MDFNKERINYPGLTVAYMEEEFCKKTKLDLGYIIAKLDGEEFVMACYRALDKRKPDRSELDKFNRLLKQGVSKEAVCFLLIRKLNKSTLVSQQTWNLLKERYEAVQWDVSDLLLLEGSAFVNACYGEIMERRPDEAGYLNYCTLLRKGTPKEAIIYMLAGSEEAKKIKKIKNIADYKAVFDRYMNTSPVKHESKIEKLKRPFRNLAITKEVEQNLFELSVKMDYRNEVMSNLLAHIMIQNDQLLARINLLENEIQNLQGKED